jgi:hypothetical protein
VERFAGSEEAIEHNRVHDNDLMMLNACGGSLT